MLQVLQNLKNGETQLTEVPAPQVKRGCVLIHTRCSLISPGTERMMLDFGKANWIDKARQQPDKVKMVLQKIKTDGFWPTYEAVQSKLDQPLALGYSNVGEVIAVGEGVTQFKAGDRVVSNGPHAEMVCVPQNLCAKIPDGVSYEQASFTVLGAIALQGVRLLNPTLGETVAVMGLGLIGLLTVQILRAQGCQVIAFDFDKSRCEMAESYGAAARVLSDDLDPVQEAMAYTSGLGIDGVVITASTTSDLLMHQSAQMCRKRGRIILVGVTGLNLSRADFYEKELSFQVSASYGPGRYDSSYEEKGNDYPYAFVRWTAQRNFLATLNLIKDKMMVVDELVTKEFELDGVLSAYESIYNRDSALGYVIRYPETSTADLVEKNKIELKAPSAQKEKVVVGWVGAGNFSKALLLPAFAKADVRLKTIVSRQGVSGTHLGKKFGFENSITEFEEVLKDSEVNTIVIATPHNSHAYFVQKALDAGKNIYVEKPLALTKKEIEGIKESLLKSTSHLMVGFNRRFSPLSKKMKSLLDTTEQPKSIIYTVNSGAIPPDHWTQDLQVGGGRLIGEGCHFIDYLRFLVGHPIANYSVSSFANPDSSGVANDKFTVSLEFTDGSIGTIHYFSNGHKSFPKERVEVFCSEKILHLDNFRSLKGYGWSGFSSMKLSRQDKGITTAVHEFVKSLSGNENLIPKSELIEVSEKTIEMSGQLK